MSNFSLLNDRELDLLVAEQVMGLIPCDGWSRINFGSGGGPAVRKNCDHPNNTCYPIIENAGAFGVAGGCPRYSTESRAWVEIIDHMIKEDGMWAIEYDSNGVSVSVTLGDPHCPHRQPYDKQTGHGFSSGKSQLD